VRSDNDVLLIIGTMSEAPLPGSVCFRLCLSSFTYWWFVCCGHCTRGWWYSDEAFCYFDLPGSL